MNISWSIKNILNSFLFKAFIIAVFCVVATPVADAKTVTDSQEFISEDRLLYFENLYKRSDYNHYLLVAEDNVDNYYSYTDYYICLSNEDIEITDNLNASLNCEEMYRYYRISNNNYDLVKVNDNNLIVEDSLFYTSNIYDIDYVENRMLIALNIGLASFLLVFVLFKIFRS